jgi:thiol-disulfide isomerase/thioredoxin
MEFGATVSTCGAENLGEALHVLSQSYPADTDSLIMFQAPWCPDCVSSVPVIKKVCEEEGQRVLICHVGERDVYRSSERKSLLGPWNIACIPTLVCLGGGWRSHAVTARIDKELETCNDPEQMAQLVETFVSEQRLGVMDQPDVDQEDEASIPILPSAAAARQAQDDLDADEGRLRQEASMGVGLVFVCIMGVMLLVVLHEHHHETHNKPNNIERDYEYFLYLLMTFSPAIALGVFGWLRNRHFERMMVDMKRK